MSLHDDLAPDVSDELFWDPKLHNAASAVSSNDGITLRGHRGEPARERKGLGMSAVSKTDVAPAGTSSADTVPAPEPHHWTRTAFGVVLFVGWGLLTVIWLASTVHLVARGDIVAAITAASALALLLLLGAMEGLEVSVIDRWQQVWPGRRESYLAGWLAARQLFVALIVTTATLLANRSVLVVPGTSIEIKNGFFLGLFDLTWTTLTVLWFAQIFWKHLGATNPDRYLWLLRRPLFPIVGVVHRLGISQPGEWTADLFESRVDWPASVEELRQNQPDRPLTHGAIWRELRRGRRAERRKLKAT
jgi:hypothetical protein